jgi:carotenoid cleavage dioxygenase
VTSRDPSVPPDTKRAPGMAAMGPFTSNVMQRLDVRSGEIHQLHVEPVQSLQENCFVRRAGSKDEGDGYVMAIASNYESMTSDLVIADARHLEDGVMATVKLPFKLRSGTHTNWYPQSVLPPIPDEMS